MCCTGIVCYRVLVEVVCFISPPPLDVGWNLGRSRHVWRFPTRIISSWSIFRFESSIVRVLVRVSSPWNKSLRVILISVQHILPDEGSAAAAGLIELGTVHRKCIKGGVGGECVVFINTEYSGMIIIIILLIRMY